jgi:hypothetical protein
MKQKLYAYLLITISMTVLLAGCGSGGTTPVTTDALHASTTCISCHQDPSWTTPATGKNVVAEWKLSTHNTQNGAGCGDCHGSGFTHPASCNKCHTIGVAFNPIKNPDASGMCTNCHDSTRGFETNRVYGGIAKNTQIEHFSTPTLSAYTSGKFNARYVSKNYENSCRSCHNPHDTSSQMNILRQWARSGKGDVTALPWANYDFGRDPARSTDTPGATPANSFGADCVRCHTTTGYINYLTNNSIAPAYGGTSKTEGKEVLACNACHINYSYARRPVGQVTAFYNKSTVSKMRIRITKTYPDIGASNLCLSCHVGREIGQIIKELANPVKTENKVITPSGAYNFANAGFENSHYLTAGATIFKTSGFENRSSQYYDNPSRYAHDQVGVANFNNTGTSGPCITCHMQPNNHTFLPFAKDNAGNPTALTSTTCNNALCHNGDMAVAKIEHEKELFNAALEALKFEIQEKVKVYFNNASPYFFSNSSFTIPAKNWVTGVGTGARNMGAAFNYNLLYHDFGAFAHNRYYAKRLIYDSISWLFDNNVINTTNTNGYFSDVEAAIQNSALTEQQKIEACTYLFTDDTYTAYNPRDFRNWRPGSSLSNPMY